MISGKIGAEIECIVPRPNIPKFETLCMANNWEITTDGSIRGFSSKKFVAREIKVGVYKISDMERMLSGVKELLELIKVNKSCGLHIHISFTNIADYYKLLNWKFVDAFQKKIVSKFKTKAEKRRLTEPRVSSFCRMYRNEEDFIENTTTQLNVSFKNNRYFSVNYNAYAVHGTIEFRIFPATSKFNKFKDYTDLVLNSVENYITTATISPRTFNVTEKKVTKRENNEPQIFKEVLLKPKKEIPNGN